MAFFFSPKTNDFEISLDNIKTFIEEHNSFEDLDDFQEKSERRIGKTVIIYFNDNYMDNIIDYFLKQHNHYLLPLIIFIGSQKENDELKNKIIMKI